MSAHNAIDWTTAGVKGVATIVLANFIGWVEVGGVFKAVVMAGAATVGSYVVKKLLTWVEPKIKNQVSKIKQKFKSYKK